MRRLRRRRRLHSFAFGGFGTRSRFPPNICIRSLAAAGSRWANSSNPPGLPASHLAAAPSPPRTSGTPGTAARRAARAAGSVDTRRRPFPTAALRPSNNAGIASHLRDLRDSCARARTCVASRFCAIIRWKRSSSSGSAVAGSSFGARALISRVNVSCARVAASPI